MPAEAVLSRFGLVRGPVHAELRVAGDRLTVVEVAGRSIGGLCSRTLELGLGISLEELILAYALGRDPAPGRRDARAAGVMMIPIPRRGMLRAGSW